MKKFLLLAALISLFYGCENLTSVNKGMTLPAYQQNSLKQESFFLNDSGTAYLLDILSQNIKSNAVRSYETGNYFDIYMGEYLSIPCLDADNPALILAPNVQSYDAFIKNGRFYFRSLYQGVYTFNLMREGSTGRTVTINNKSNYKVSNGDLKNIVYKNYNEKNLESLKNSATLFKLLFPDSTENKDISFLLFNLAVLEGNENIIKTESSFLEENYNLSSQDKMKLIAGKEKVLGNNYNLSEKYLDSYNNSPELNDYVMRNIIKRGNPTSNELLFLENIYATNPTKDLADIIGVLYFKAGNVIKGTHYSNTKNGNLPSALNNSLVMGNNKAPEESSQENPTETLEYSDFLNNYQNGISYYRDGSYAEAILLLEKSMLAEGNFIEKENIPFYLGDSYMMSGNYKKAKENFLLLKNTNEFYPNAMYKLGELYYKNGEKDLAIKTFEQNRDNFPGTVWGRKSSIYLLKLK
ncbi:tetratricopeptide repeat protein [Fusobacterium sp.]|uniref:tetratricopeptide repeat protein n=1 Tax=Fusobacterium sp. TaxID=68766 RepID=UPI00262C867D|nr:tetratricopeptide repeat protein [Fusobacterium sp.]